MVREMLDTISLIESAVLKETYVKKLAARLGVSPGAIWEEYRKIKRSPSPPRQSRPAPARKVDKYEARLLKYLLEHDTVLSLIKDELDPAAFSPLLQPVVTLMLDLLREGKTPLSRTLTTALRDRESQEMVSRWLLEPHADESKMFEVAQLLINIQKKRLKAKIDECRQAVVRNEAAGEEETALLRKSRALTRELEELPARIREKMSV